MPHDKLTIGFVRRGYSASGGAEAYLKRLARGLVARGHLTHLFASPDWPQDDSSFNEITRLRATSAIGFADEVKKMQSQNQCDVLMSLEAHLALRCLSSR